MSDIPMPKTCCMDCKHHIHTHTGSTDYGPSPGTWFYHYCTHPDNIIPQVRSPVTGELSWCELRRGLLENEKSFKRRQIVQCSEKYNNCNKFNDGDCFQFEVKK